PWYAGGGIRIACARSSTPLRYPPNGYASIIANRLDAHAGFGLFVVSVPVKGKATCARHPLRRDHALPRDPNENRHDAPPPRLPAHHGGRRPALAGRARRPRAKIFPTARSPS